VIRHVDLTASVRVHDEEVEIPASRRGGTRTPGGEGADRSTDEERFEAHGILLMLSPQK
jgi:hypothetical protein